MKHKVGDEVRVMRSFCEGIKDIRAMIGKVFTVEKIYPLTKTYIINGYAFSEDEVTEIPKI